MFPNKHLQIVLEKEVAYYCLTQKDSCQELQTAWSSDLSKFFVILSKVTNATNWQLIAFFQYDFAIIYQIHHNQYHNVQKQGMVSYLTKLGGKTYIIAKDQ